MAISRSRRTFAGRMSFAATWLALSAAGAYAGEAEDLARAQKYVEEGDVVRAMPILRKLADAGFVPAQVKLADMYDKAEENEAAVALYRQAAEKGSADALFGLASMTAAGEGVKRDADEALRLLRLAGEQSHQPAIHALAQAYIGAQPALKATADFAAQALRWNTLAADGGYVPAMEALARAYRSGEWGVAVDAAKAQSYEKRAETARRAVASGSQAKTDKR